MIAFFWFVLAVAVGILANSRGRSGFGWFLLAVLLTPLLGFILVLASKDLSKAEAAAVGVPGGATHVRCPACAEWVLPEAAVCKHCGGALTPDPDFYVVRAQRAAAEKKEEGTNLLIGVGALVGVFLLAALLSRCVG
jgi:hypothetical protein